MLCKTQLLIHPSPKKYKLVLSKEHFWGVIYVLPPAVKIIFVPPSILHTSINPKGPSDFCRGKRQHQGKYLGSKSLILLQNCAFWGADNTRFIFLYFYIFTLFSGCLRKGNRFSLGTICAPQKGGRDSSIWPGDHKKRIKVVNLSQHLRAEGCSAAEGMLGRGQPKTPKTQLGCKQDWDSTLPRLK